MTQYRKRVRFFRRARNCEDESAKIVQISVSPSAIGAWGLTLIDSSLALSNLFQAAFDETNLKSLSAMLRSAAQACGGMGCALWQLRNGPDQPNPLPIEPELVNLPSSAHLYVLAHGFPEPCPCYFHNLPLSMASGRAVLEGTYEVVDSQNDPAVDRDNVFYRVARPGSQFATRVIFPDKTVGVLTIYRLEKGALSREGKERFRFLGNHVPRIYQTVRDRVSYRLVESVSALISDVEDAHPFRGTRADTDSEQGAMQGVCEAISEGLACKSVALYLSNPLHHPEDFRLVAETCPRMRSKGSYKLNDRGLTGEALRTNKPIFVLDVLHFPEELRKRTGWEPRYDIAAAVRAVLGIDKAEELPPVTAAVVPMAISGKAVGVLHCTLCPTSPHFLAERETDLLRILASKIRSFWGRQIRFGEIQQNEASWRSFVDRLNKLSRHTQEITAKSKGLTKTRVFQKEIYQEALGALEKSIEGADCLDVALPDAERRTIGAEVTAGRFWDRTHSDGKPRSQARLSLYDMHNAWAHVFAKHEAVFIEDTANPGATPYANFISEAKQALFVPILADRDCIGVISVRSSGMLNDAEKARRMTELVALEIALYHRLTDTLSLQTRTYQDMEHQLRTPIFQALKRVKWLMRQELEPDTELLAVNGLLSKGRRVLINMRMYESLAAEQTVPVRPSDIAMESLLKLLIEAARDNEILFKSRSTRFLVDRQSFISLGLPKVLLDSALLEQVLNNLLDNAGKYSNPNTTVSIVGHLDEEKQFWIIIKNQGVPIDREMVEKMGTRGFRGKIATARTAEGSGVGLYIVRQIMAAHKGDLKVDPTDPLGFNRVSVWFPTK